MKERPILYSGSMVRAILDDRKTQTRRIMKPQPNGVRRDVVPVGARSPSGFTDDHGLAIRCPFGSPGDRLWVREAWQIFDPHPDGDGDALGADRIKHGQRAPWDGVVNERAIEWVAAYRADGDVAHKTHGPALWRPSIHMPRWASRLTLDVTAVRVERLQAISEDDARAEGVEPYTPPHGSISPDQRVPGVGFDDVRLGDQPHRLPFAHLWDSINGDRASWDSNPWVWVVEFKRAGATQ